MLPQIRISMLSRTLTASFLTLALAGGALGESRAAPATLPAVELTSAASTAQHRFTQVTTNAAFRAGTSEGVRVVRGSLRMRNPSGNLRYAGKRWAWSRWTSPVTTPGHRFTEVLPSWNVVTPKSTLVQVQARVRSTTGRFSTWKLMGSWTTLDSSFRRVSGAAQQDSVARVDTDTLAARPGVSLDGYQLRMLLLRSPSSKASASVRAVQAVASRPGTLRGTSRPLLGAKSLHVPRFSQMIHRGQYPQFGGGGQAWCSPTSLAMLLGYYGRLPSPTSYAWVKKGYAEPWVDHLARVVYDYRYQGAGNWAFNTAYAANLTTDAFVTRLPDLREAERFIAAGIPLAASISFSRGQLTGAPISATAGHLVVITGFTSNGNVVVNDPAAANSSSVRRVYDRAQFERAWQTRSSGTVYVVRDAAHPLPARTTSQSW